MVKKVLGFVCLVMIGCSQTSQSSIDGSATSADMLTLRKTVTQSATAFVDVTRARDLRVPKEFLEKAQCIAILPGMVKAAFIAGANHGYGVASCRAGSGWSEPAFIALTGGSFGLQFGAEQSDLVLLMMDEKSKRALLSNQMTLGVDVGIAAGPVGEKVKGKTNVDLNGIRAYAKSQGAFAGLSLEGAVLRPDDTSNEVYYGKNLTAEKLLLRAAAQYTTPEVEELLSKFPVY